ncbi:MAG: type II secretion system protein [Armatimonadota bacterium]|jgi:prepilin-type N-terminal cleavage/methylation domain-containing protein
MTHNNRRHGFTLVEMLVVISIIVVLVAILFPVISGARHKARMVRCQTNMSALTQALTEYKRQYHRYPPRPAYDSDAEIYTGGFSSLYPDYVDSYADLLCPDDKTIVGRQDEARQRRYSSYNGRIELAEDIGAANPWEFAVDTDTGNQMITYNYHGYDELGWDRNVPLSPPADPAPAWLDRGWKYYPRLMNIYAPEYTLVTHCTFHRDFYSKETERRDTFVNVGSETDTLLVDQWQADEGSGSLFEKQN